MPRFSYHIKDEKHDTTIIVSSRPRSLSHSADERKEASKECRKQEKADAYLSVTDSFCVAPSRAKVPFVWLPWNEGRKPHPELYYGANKTLIWWVHYQKFKKILVFCDGGSHRSVTIFGIFLLTYFPKEAKEIVAARVDLNRQDLNDEENKRDRSSWAQPLEYARRYLDEFPADRLLLSAMGSDYLSRLDNHSKRIYEMVKERYGDKS